MAALADHFDEQARRVDLAASMGRVEQLAATRRVIK